MHLQRYLGFQPARPRIAQMNSSHFVLLARPHKPRSAMTRFNFARSSCELALFAVGYEASIQ